MSVPGPPGLAGVHHLKLPVTDLARSRAWYHSRLGYEVVIEWVEHGQLTGCGMSHPDGGPQLPCGWIPSAPGRPPDSTTSA